MSEQDSGSVLFVYTDNRRENEWESMILPAENKLQLYFLKRKDNHVVLLLNHHFQASLHVEYDAIHLEARLRLCSVRIYWYS